MSLCEQDEQGIEAHALKSFRKSATSDLSTKDSVLTARFAVEPYDSSHVPGIVAGRLCLIVFCVGGGHFWDGNGVFAARTLT